MAIDSSEKTIFSFNHIKGITLGAGEEVDEIGDRATEEQVAWVYGTDFTAGSLARLQARDRTWGRGLRKVLTRS